VVVVEPELTIELDDEVEVRDSLDVGNPVEELVEVVEIIVVD